MTTTGEWKLVKDTQASWIIKANGRIIATVWSLEDGKDNIARAQEAQANAHILRAAPELLAIVKRINWSFYVEGTTKAMKTVMAETKALIAKAEGR